MNKVYDRIFVGCDYECFEDKEGWVTVHACKHPCHCRAVGYRGSLSPDHPSYLIHPPKDYLKSNNLYLNIIDVENPKYFDKLLFESSLEFIEYHWNKGKKIFIHCNIGESRSPSIALLFLAKKLRVINDKSYEMAKKDFLKIYPLYYPNNGIRIYLEKHWREL